jgi:hypothetical protein
MRDKEDFAQVQLLDRVPLLNHIIQVHIIQVQLLINMMLLEKIINFTVTGHLMRAMVLLKYLYKEMDVILLFGTRVLKIKKTGQTGGWTADGEGQKDIDQLPSL